MARFAKKVNMKDLSDDEDDWTAADYENDVSEKQQRYAGTREKAKEEKKDHRNLADLAAKTSETSDRMKAAEYEAGGSRAAYGYGGKFGVQTDRVDKSAAGWDHIERVEAHSSQKDYSKGFGGKYGVEHEKKDKSAEDWTYSGKTEKHSSQKDYSEGFGGKYGVQKDRVDSSAVGWDYDGKVAPHSSQKDHSQGFGGKFGVDKDRQDSSAVGWDYKEKVPEHPSQKDHSQGFGGKFGVQSDRQDSSAVGWEHRGESEKHSSQKDYSKGFGGKFGVDSANQDAAAVGYDYRAGTGEKREPQVEVEKSQSAKDIRSKFENLSVNSVAPKPAAAPSPKRPVAVVGANNKQSANHNEERASLHVDPPQQLPVPMERKSPRNLTPEPPTLPIEEQRPPSPTPQPQEPEADQIYSNLSYDDRPPPQQQPQPPAGLDLDGAFNEFNETLKSFDSPPRQQPDSAYHDQQQAPDSPPDQYCKVLFDYDATDETDLELKEGEIVRITETINEDWFNGETGGRSGMFPSNYVERRGKHENLRDFPSLGKSNSS